MQSGLELSRDALGVLFGLVVILALVAGGSLGYANGYHEGMEFGLELCEQTNNMVPKVEYYFENVTLPFPMDNSLLIGGMTQKYGD